MDRPKVKALLKLELKSGVLAPSAIGDQTVVRAETVE